MRQRTKVTGISFVLVLLGFFGVMIAQPYAGGEVVKVTGNEAEEADARFEVDEAGIKFFKGSLQEALALAKSEGKMVFLDAYTTWCGPCRWMSANVFTKQAVGDYFNKYFVNVKMDMERGEGPSTARRYRVNAYPTLLFLEGDGEVVHRALGAHRENDFLNLGKQVVSKM